MVETRTRIRQENIQYNVFPDAQSGEFGITNNLDVFEEIGFIPIQSGGRTPTGAKPLTLFDAVVTSTGLGGTTPRFFKHRGIKVPNLPNASTPNTNPVVEISSFFTDVGTGNLRLNVVPRVTEHSNTIYDIFFSYNISDTVAKILTVVQVDNLSNFTDVLITSGTVEQSAIVQRNQDGKVVYDIFLLDTV